MPGVSCSKSSILAAQFVSSRIHKRKDTYLSCITRTKFVMAGCPNPEGGVLKKLRNFKFLTTGEIFFFQQKDFLPNQNQGWNGTFRGQNMDSGVYIYFLELLQKDNKTKVIKGEITLLH